MNNNETFKNTAESEQTRAETKDESREFKPIEQTNETTQRLAEDYKKAESLAAETLKQIREMKGKVESMPQTAAEKRLYENVGYDVESLTSDKEAFAKMSNSEMYNNFQKLTLENTKKFVEKEMLSKIRETLPKIFGMEDVAKMSDQEMYAKFKEAIKVLPRDDGGREASIVKVKAFMDKLGKVSGGDEVRALNLVTKNIDSSLSLFSKNPKGRAIKGYAEIMDENVNKKADGYMAYDGLTKLYKKSGYDSSIFNKNKVYDSFQNDLAESLLNKDQQETFAKMQKEATRNSGNKASTFATGGMSQKIGVEPIFSRKTIYEMTGEKAPEVAVTSRVE